MVIIIAILLLSFLVLIHEIGHFLAAKWAGVHIEEFGLGYPPHAVTLFKKWGTNFTLNWIPFGGFVKMEGEEGASSEKKTKQGTAFYEKGVGQRLVIILAGATINFLFGIIAFTIVYSWTGIPTLWDLPRVAAIQPNTPAASAGFPNDVPIVSIKHGETTTPISTRDQATQIIKEAAGQSITINTTGPCQNTTCEDKQQSFVVTPRKPENTPQNEGSVGIIFQVAYQKFYPWYEMPFRGALVGVEQAVGLAMFIARTFIETIGQGFQRGTIPQEFMSPVGIVDEIGRSGVVQEGFLALIHLAGMISVNLAILNVMPIPALDGGRAFFILLSKVVNKKWVTTIENYANYGGMVILVLLLLLLSVRDIHRIIVR
jgi:regulator of sigma E protease